MPIHEWMQVDAELFHTFHQSWIIKLCDTLNAESLPSDYFALPEQSISGPIRDVLTLELAPESGGLIWLRPGWRWPPLLPGPN